MCRFGKDCSSWLTDSVRLYTQPDMYPPVSLALSLPIPTAATSEPNTSPSPCFLFWIRGYCPLFGFWGTKNPHSTSFFEFWLQGYFGLTLPITTTAGWRGVGLCHPYKIPRYKCPKSQKQGHTATRSAVLSLGQGLLPIFEFRGPLNLIAPLF